MNKFYSGMSGEEILDFRAVPGFHRCPVRRPVNFLDIHGDPSCDFPAVGADITGGLGGAGLTIHRFSHNPGDRCLPHSPRSAENEGMGDAIIADGVPEGSGSLFLPRTSSKDWVSIYGLNKIIHDFGKFASVRVA